MSASFLEKFKYRGSSPGKSDDEKQTNVHASNGKDISGNRDYPTSAECESLLEQFQLKWVLSHSSKKALSNIFITGTHRIKYPNIDKMVIQDTLISHNWNREAAQKQLDMDHPLPKLAYVGDAGPAHDGPLDGNRQNEDGEATVLKKVQTVGRASMIIKGKNTHKYAAINAAQRDGQPLSGDNQDNDGDDIIVRKKKKNQKTKDTRKRARFEFSDDDGDKDEVAAKREKIYNSSDSDSESEQKYAVTTEVANVRKQVVDFLNDAPPLELGSVPTCSNKRIEKILSVRPFSTYAEAVSAMTSTPGLSPEILNEVQSFLASRNIVAKLMSSCEGLVREMKVQVETIQQLKEMKIKQQPKSVSDHLKLAPHQLIGINWMALLYEKGLNGILADEMGLGKTIQVVTFLTWLLERGEKGPHLVVVPSSTLDNWHREFSTWCPQLKVVIYSGPQEDRKALRLDVVNGRLSMNVILATYNTLASTPEDRGFFKKLQFVYAIFDEAHMLKNMNSQRFQSLIQIASSFKLMLTGTPLQNNLIELMSLLTFTMPHLFCNKTTHMKSLFKGSKTSGGEETARNVYERERIKQAKAIMQPFVLRRLKADVLGNLPTKHDNLEKVEMVEIQKQLYKKTVTAFKRSKAERRLDEDVNAEGSVLMQLRKAANHPLLLRTHYSDNRLRQMAKIICKQPSHKESTVSLVFEDMQVMSDFQLHSLCLQFGNCLKEYLLPDETITNSGKFKYLQEFIPSQLKQNNRILIFSQFTMMLDIIEKFLYIEKYNYLRIDGSTPVSDRQDLIDAFVNDENIPIFLLSTKACGLGINLTAANVVVLHDIDYNPYNDKQAEDRCHRIGQTREVHIYRLISKETIEEAMFAVAQKKLRLEQRITTDDGEGTKDEAQQDKAVLGQLLKRALGEDDQDEN
ncbi:SWI/SNF-related matrix-associated actin-dependent regulator of chromatin subfamily A containing DEAD/H box 1 homolog isoform X1 [Varroa jacobsoni]|uniref:SWI/SNF-related matrix-associated actin-dependent regulator of chromatin subfamily A containing DEAD/H box 1 homolog isoform X1 n=2 Tax=Varroa jacobsoni TaxID=62625 RepID=UPI000BF3C595|nr:SWI/SNF-related matrix-associated actin-dependent regulator of chromatin subfamily A containing DEAD/H box 1 homolog isoform X1 [Varroa jacobsoni]